MAPNEATIRLDQIVKEAYKRRSRQLPNNISEIVDTLKADLIKYMPAVTLDVIDEAVAFETLHDDKTQLSPTFLFAAIRKHYTQPTEVRDFDQPDLAHWKAQLRWLESRNQGASAKADECRWWIYHIEKGDDEGETIRLLDICAEWVRKGDERQQAYTVRKGDIVVELPAFNPRREFAYLVMRGQLALNDTDQYFDQAITDINAERLASRHHRLTRDEAEKDPDVLARQKRLAVIGWLRRCNTEGTTPSAVLTPLADELQYRQLRRTTP